MPRSTSLLGVLAGAALVVSACGGGTDSRVEQIEALEQQSNELAGGTDAFGDITDAQAACLESEVPDLDMLATLTDSTTTGVEERVALTGAMIECLPDLRTNEPFVEQITATFNAALGGTADVDTTEGGCLLGYILDNSSNPASALADGSSAEDIEVVGAGFDVCFDETTQAIVRGDEGTGAQAYGDDARLDGLYDDCQLGDNRACDILYFEATFGSEYSDLAANCAGRGDGVNTCTPGLDTDAEGAIDPSAPALDTLEADCAADDMTACDLLYRASPLGSDLEQFGFTCGGKIVAGGLPDCRTRFPS